MARWQMEKRTAAPGNVYWPSQRHFSGIARIDRYSFFLLNNRRSSTLRRVTEMSPPKENTTIGYSVLETFEECYQYNENACFIADSIPGAERFMAAGFTDASDCRIDEIEFADIMSDYGASLGEYAMEAEAFARFKAIADQNNVQFNAQPYDGDDSLLVVEIDGVSRLDDD